MKSIPGIYTTTGELLAPGARIHCRTHHPLRDVSTDREFEGVVKTLHVAEGMTSIRVALNSGETVFLTPQYRWQPPVRLEARLTDLDYTVSVFRPAQQQAEMQGFGGRHA